MRKLRVSKILIAILCAIVLVITPVTSYATTLHNANNSKYMIKGKNGIAKKHYRIVNQSNSSYSDFCISGGGKLTCKPMVAYPNEINLYELGDGNATLYFKSKDAYRSVMWLVDNAIIINSATTSNKDLMDMMKSNLIAQFQSVKDKTETPVDKKTLLTSAQTAVNELNIYQIEVVEACAFWHYSKNPDESRDNANLTKSAKTSAEQEKLGIALKNALIYVADLNKNYIHSNKTPSIKAGSEFEVNVANSEAGPFAITVIDEADVSKEMFKVTVNGTEQDTFEMELRDGGWYLTNLNNLTSAGGQKNIVNIEYKGLKTVASIVYKGYPYQNLITINKSMIRAQGGATGTNDYPVDLALVKTIVSYKNDGELPIVVDRFNPKDDVDTTPLEDSDDTTTTAIYTVKKAPIIVKKGAEIEYKFYIFNEGKNPAKAKIEDYLPKELELVDSEGMWEKVDDKSTAEYTCYRLKEYAKVKSEETDIIEAYEIGQDIHYAEVSMVCKLAEDADVSTGDVLTNYAEICEDDYGVVDGQGELYDIDSIPEDMDLNKYINDGYVQGTTSARNSYSDEEKWGVLNKGFYNQQDDDDFERITVVETQQFDLALRKYISEVNGISLEESREPKLNGYEEEELLLASQEIFAEGKTTFEYQHSKKPIEVNAGDTVTYTIRVYKESLAESTDGYASVITDNYSDWLEFDKDATDEANNGSMWKPSFTKTDGENEIVITCTPNEITTGSEYINDPFKYYGNKYVAKFDDCRYYQEIKLVFNVKDEAPIYDETKNGTEDDTRIINVARISEYYIKTKTEDTTVTGENEVEKYNNEEIVDRDSSVGSTVAEWAVNTNAEGVEINNPNSASDILKNAKVQLDEYDENHDLYIPGVQDDDDFDTVIVKAIPTTYKFKVNKIGEGSYGSEDSPLQGVEFNLSCENLQINISGMQTDATGNINFFGNEGKEYQIPVGQDKAIECFTLTEIAKDGTSYIPMSKPVYVYVMFVRDANNNSITRVSGVKVSENKIENINEEAYNQLGNSISVASKKDGKDCKVSAKISTQNEITVSVTNPPVEGEFYTVLIKKDSRGNGNANEFNEGNEIDGIEFKINNAVYKTSQTESGKGSIEYPRAPSDASKDNPRKIRPGVGKVSFEEVATQNADGSITYIGLKEPIDLYCNVVWDNYEYIVNKVGFTREFNADGEGTEWTSGYTLTDSSKTFLVKKVQLADGSDAYAKLLFVKTAEGKGIKAILYVPNALANFNIKIKKIDADTKKQIAIPFTVKDVTNSISPVSILTNLPFPTNGTSVVNAENVSASKTYVYTIKEEDNDLKYRNIFKELGVDYIKLFVKVNEKGAVTKVDYEYIFNESVKEADKADITEELNKYVQKPTFEAIPPVDGEENGYINNISVVIENPVIEEKEFDLSLRKFITKVNDKELKGEESREPKVDLTTLIDGDPSKDGEKTATYTHTKEPVWVNPTDIVEYTLRVYNEGEIDGYASRVIDDIPAGVTMVAPKYDENGKALNQNAEYRWTMYKKIDAKDVTIANDGADALEYKNKSIIVYKDEYYIETDKAEEAVIISTDYLSKENGEAMMADATKDKDDAENPNLIVKFDGEKLSYKDIKVQFKVNPTKEANIIITNYAQISENTDSDGKIVEDRDSTVNEWIDGEDDQDIERIKVTWFDLALYKWVSSTIVIEDGVTKEYESGHSQDYKDKIVNVTVAKDKLDKTVVKFKYQIKVKNESPVAGYAKEIKDHIPEGLKFVEEDNVEYGWKLQEDGTITTDYLKDTLLKKDETAEVTVILTWINGSDNLGAKVNFAEISEDYNDFNTPDIDSTPDNFKGESIEDDEDDDVVMLNIKTGLGIDMTYVYTAIMFIVTVGVGVVLVKKYTNPQGRRIWVKITQRDR